MNRKDRRTLRKADRPIMTREQVQAASDYAKSYKATFGVPIYIHQSQWDLFSSYGMDMSGCELVKRIH